MCRTGRIGSDGLGGKLGRDRWELLARYTYTLEMTLTKLKYIPRIPHFIVTFHCHILLLDSPRDGIHCTLLESRDSLFPSIQTSLFACRLRSSQFL